MGINLDTLEPNLCIDGQTTYGGCSGEIVRPIGLKCVAQIRQSSDLPILGMGGISTWQDAVQYFAVGSDAVQICTEVMINGYGIINGLTKGLLNYLEEKGMNNVSELKNIAIEKITAHNDLNKKYLVNPKIDKEKCVSCGKCMRICEESEYNALSMCEKEIKLDKDKCQGCSLCSIACPQSAISMEKR